MSELDVEQIRAEARGYADELAEWRRERAALQAERDALRALLNEKDYIQCKADYNRGHLSHHNYLAEKERGLGLANEQLTDSAREPVARFDENLGP